MRLRRPAVPAPLFALLLVALPRLAQAADAPQRSGAQAAAPTQHVVRPRLDQNYCLSQAEASDGTAPAAVHLAACDAVAEQVWTLDGSQLSLHNGLCLEAVGRLHREGGTLRASPCDGDNDRQQFERFGHLLRLANSGHCMAVDGGAAEHGVTLTLSACTARSHGQLFAFVEVDGADYGVATAQPTGSETDADEAEAGNLYDSYADNGDAEGNAGASAADALADLPAPGGQPQQASRSDSGARPATRGRSNSISGGNGVRRTKQTCVGQRYSSYHAPTGSLAAAPKVAADAATAGGAPAAAAATTATQDRAGKLVGAADGARATVDGAAAPRSSAQADTRPKGSVQQGTAAAAASTAAKTRPQQTGHHAGPSKRGTPAPRAVQAATSADTAAVPAASSTAHDGPAPAASGTARDAAAPAASGTVHEAAAPAASGTAHEAAASAASGTAHEVAASAASGTAHEGDAAQASATTLPKGTAPRARRPKYGGRPAKGGSSTAATATAGNGKGTPTAAAPVADNTSAGQVFAPAAASAAPASGTAPSVVAVGNGAAASSGKSGAAAAQVAGSNAPAASVTTGSASKGTSATTTANTASPSTQTTAALQSAGTYLGFSYISFASFLNAHPMLKTLRQDIIDAAASVQPVLPPILLAAIAMEESSGNPDVSGGLMQFTNSDTWAAYGQGDINNGRDSLFAAARYLTALLKEKKDDLSAALTEYNGAANGAYVSQIQSWLNGGFPYGAGT